MPKVGLESKERWVIGYGKLSDTDERVPDDDTVFEIGSITKVFTGMLLAQAVLNGEVKLDDPISLYLPEGVVALESILFILIGLWRFSREEF
jgi:CubicO group peptidase (beta-lactamase class C family)